MRVSYLCVSMISLFAAEAEAREKDEKSFKEEVAEDPQKLHDMFKVNNFPQLGQHWGLTPNEKFHKQRHHLCIFGTFRQVLLRGTVGTGPACADLIIPVEALGSLLHANIVKHAYCYGLNRVRIFIVLASCDLCRVRSWTTCTTGGARGKRHRVSCASRGTRPRASARSLWPKTSPRRRRRRPSGRPAARCDRLL